MHIRSAAYAALLIGAASCASIPNAASAQGNGYGLACPSLIAQVEAQKNIPRGLLMAIAVTESAIDGKPDPYAMNIAGRSYHARGIQDMANVIQANWTKGVKSIDVGCMQVNLKFHGHKFARMTDLLDSVTNVEYGASYLVSLATEAGSWKEAVMNYHNRNNPSRRAWYGCKVWNNYLRVSMAQSGFLPCGKTPAGSSTASVGSTKPIQIAGYNAPARAAGPLTSPAQIQPMADYRNNHRIGDIEIDIPTNADQVKGSLTIVGANKNMPDVVNNDARSNAFRSVRPADWSDRVQATTNVTAVDLPITGSSDQSGFGRVSSDN